MQKSRVLRDWGDTSAKLFRQVERLARESRRNDSSFQRTRAPFVRLRDIWAHQPSTRSMAHPAHCSSSACEAPLIDRYFRRADGWVLCPTCFSRQAYQR